MTGRTPMIGTAVATRPMPIWFAAGSTTLHVLVVAVIIWRSAPTPPAPPSDGATVEVEYVNQTAATMGVSNPDATAPADDPAPADAASVAAPPPPPASPYADVPMPPAAAASDATDVHAGAPTSASGNAIADRDAMTVTGAHMVSSGPDAAYRNMPPTFPREAIRSHQQGSVQVTIHITPAGLPDDVQTVISSGSPALDNAVRDAVLKWHFKPAIKDGVAVASVYRLQMNFRNGAAP
jgi:protein TonB